ncbi:MAG: DUF1684 domain-containing protein [Sphingobacteriaceae bacterium]|nr:DUF1684 domain-containing protein [Sphingobacteriaceae bacterium]
MNYLFLFLVSALSAFTQVKKDSIIKNIKVEQEKLVKFYLDSTTTPLARSERKDFEGIHHFPVNLKYRVVAQLEKFDQKDTVIFPTSSGKKKRYIKYAKANFKIDGKKHSLVLYRMADIKKPEYAKLLFLPFTDLTSNNETYGGGRYIDLEITDANTILIDFNLCYQPYCAYSHNGWNCPIPPQENFVNAKIKAGVKN